MRLRQTIVAFTARRKAGQSTGRVGVGDRAADRAPVADLRVADDAGHLAEPRVVVDDDRVLVDLAVGRAGADPELVVRLRDAVEARRRP